MTTTNTYQGIENINKPTSRVLNPPGGKSNDIFGTEADDREQAKITNAERNRQSSIFGNDYPEPENPSAGKRHYPTQDHNTHNLLFGHQAAAMMAAAAAASSNVENIPPSLLSSQPPPYSGVGDPPEPIVPIDQSFFNVFGRDSLEGGINPITGQMEGQQAMPNKKQAEVNPITGLGQGEAPTVTDGPVGVSRKERMARERVAPELLPAAGGAANARHPPGGKSSGPLW